MHTLIQSETFRKLEFPVVLATGFFDGVHLGHRRVLEAAIDHARKIGGEAWALTFDQHPLSVLAPERRPPMLTTINCRLNLLAELGMDGCLMLPFTTQLAGLTPAEFLTQISRGPGAPLSALCCGANWRFGHRAAGSPEWLRQRGDITVIVVPPAIYNNEPVSSTRIREAIRTGNLGTASAMLGRHYAISGIVQHGRGLARKLGIPTANFTPNAEVMPPTGVYAVRSTLGDRVVTGVASLGYRPTFADACPDTPVLESHFFDFAGDLYGAYIEVSFVERLRDEIKFANQEDLVAQIHQDIAAAKRMAQSAVRS